jgi:hypothetical protein
MKQELYESRCSHRGSKSKGVSRDFSPAARDDVRILPQAPALLQRMLMNFLMVRDLSFCSAVIVRHVFFEKS